MKLIFIFMDLVVQKRWACQVSMQDLSFFQISEKQEVKNCTTRKSYNGKQSKSPDHVLDYLKGYVRVITKLVSM